MACAFVLACILGFGTALPLRAEPLEAGSKGGSPGEMVDETLARLLGLIETFLKSVPVYETPEILENGDIIIRRKRTEPPPAKPDAPQPEKTKPAPAPDTSRT